VATRALCFVRGIEVVIIVGDSADQRYGVGYDDDRE
jgi:hypothetical protein